MAKIKYDVFISYSRKDYLDDNKNVIPNNVVLQVIEALEKAGISYWYDQEGILDGDNYAKLISENIQASKTFVFISTKNSNNSEWTGSEIATAHMMKKHIIPVRVDYSAYHTDVILYIAKLSFIDYKTNPEKGINDLVKSIKTYLKRLEAKEEEERKNEEEKRKQQEQAAQMHRLEQQRIINEIKKRSITLNSEEAKIEADRRILLSETERITDPQQKESLKSFIIEGSPSRKQLEKELKSYEAKIEALEKKNDELSQNNEKLKSKTATKKTVPSDDSKTKNKLCWVLGILLLLSICITVYLSIQDPIVKVKSSDLDSLTIVELVTTGNEYFYGGNGKSKDYAAALLYYSKATEKGSSTGQDNIGWMYQKGFGVEQNYKEALKWYRKAAKQGNANAQYHIGYMYQYGLGCEKNNEEAIKWYKKAVNSNPNGHKDAKQKLEELK